MSAKVLGIDLGNAKVKFVVLEPRGEGPEAIWGGGSIPYSPKLMPDRRADFDEGLPLALARFLISHAFLPEDFDRVVVSTSHFFSYPSFEEAHRHTVELLERLFPANEVLLLGAEGRLYTLAEARALSGPQVVRFAATKFWGSAYLASKLISNGLSIDTGTTSTDLIPILEGKPDPAAAQDPDRYNLDRLKTQRFIWYGMTATPLDYLAHEAEAAGEVWPLYPRVAKTEVLTAILDLAPRDLAEAHAYGGAFPSVAAARFQLAQACGLDCQLIPEETLTAIARDLYQRLVARVAASVRKVAEHAGLGPLSEAEAAVMGLGRESVARDALLQAGFRAERLVDVEAVLGSELSSVSTAYGAALKGLEDLLGETLELRGGVAAR
jgi:Predicted transcriptional regulator/sugar kinase